MSFNIIRLQDLLNEFDTEMVKDIISDFKSIPTHENKPSDVECFLHEKAIQFEKSALSTTHLIFSDDGVLLGYFALANKPLTMTKKNYDKLSSNQKRKLCQNGYKTESGGYQINSYLIGQLGKNYSARAKEYNFKGNELLTLAYETLVEATKIINAKYAWIECENLPKLISFYKLFGFTEIHNYVSANGLKVLVLKIDREYKK